MRAFTKLMNGLISIVVALALLIAGAYAGYCLWDNQQIYAAAENVQAELLNLKPKAAEETEETGPSFAELLAINPDVRAWVTMYGTKIDHPVLQGSTNLDYINTDVYGNFALAGSIFLDSRNDGGFADPYSLLYGHHMEKGAMFGDLDKYLEAKVFEENDSGELLLPDRSYSLKVIACLQTNASDDNIFAPQTWDEDVRGLLDYAEREGKHVRGELIEELRARLDDELPVQILALSTCSSDFTDARTIVLTVMNTYVQKESGDAQA